MTGLICQLLDLVVWVVLIWVVLSWIPTFSGHPLHNVKELLNKVLNPLLKPFRTLIGPVRVGNVGVDLSPLALLVAVFLLERILC